MTPALINMGAAVSRILAAGNIVVTTHARADGDAMGSAAAMQRLLRAAGKRATALVHEPVIPRYRFISEIEPLAVWSAQSAASVLADCDLVVIVDTCAAAQLGDVTGAIRATAAPRLAIDHHVTRDDVVHEAWVDPAAAACAQMLTCLADGARWAIDAQTATLLFAGLATDTGWFRFSNAGSAAFLTAARLLHAGARATELYEHIYLEEIEPRLRLTGAVLSAFELRAGGRLAVIRITRDMFARCGATSAMTEDLVNEPLRLAGVEATVLFTEPAPGESVRMSFRSKSVVDVAAIAAQFGGGGHVRAAGARLAGDFNEVCDKVIRALEQALR